MRLFNKITNLLNSKLTNQQRNKLIKTFICRGKHKWNKCGICKRCNTKIGY